MSWGGAPRGHPLPGRSESFACLLAASRHESNGKSVGRTGERCLAFRAVVWGSLAQQPALLPIVAPRDGDSPGGLRGVQSAHKRARPCMSCCSPTPSRSPRRCSPASPCRGRAHRLFEGNRPSTFMLFDALTPKALGQLIAMHEHRILSRASSGALRAMTNGGWSLKALANALILRFEVKSQGAHDPSASKLVSLVHVTAVGREKYFIGPNVVGADCRRFRRGSGVVLQRQACPNLKSNQNPMKHFFSACLLAMASSLAWGGFVGVDYETVGESEFGTTYESMRPSTIPPTNWWPCTPLNLHPWCWGCHVVLPRSLWWGVGPERQPFVVRGVSFFGLRQLVHHWLRRCRRHQRRAASRHGLVLHDV